jgi:hypothetical protein
VFFSETLAIVACTLLVIPTFMVIAPGRRSWEGLFARIRRFGVRHLMLAVAFAAWLFWLLTTHTIGWPLLLMGALLLVRFFRIWREEFVFLMDRGDEEFPGRSDKVLWAACLILLGPLGVWFFRGYHVARWPEPDVEPEERTEHAFIRPDANPAASY